jgi:hypothetical protein
MLLQFAATTKEAVAFSFCYSPLLNAMKAGGCRYVTEGKADCQGVYADSWFLYDGELALF